MKYLNYTLFVLFAVISNVYAQGDWVRIEYDGPTYNPPQWGTEGYMFDYTFYYETSASVYDLYHAHLYSYCEYQPILTINTPPVIVAPIENEEWLEIYEWQGGPPPSFIWQWTISAYHDCRAHAVDGVVQPATAKGEVRIDGKVQAVDDEETLRKKSGAQVDSDVAAVYLGKDWGWGVIFDIDDDPDVLSIGTTGVQQAVDYTTTAGPFERYSIINTAYAITEVTNDAGYEKAWGRASIDIYFTPD